MEGLTSESNKTDAQAWFKTNKGRLLEIASKYLEKFAVNGTNSGSATPSDRSRRSVSVAASESSDAQQSNDAGPVDLTADDFRVMDKPRDYQPVNGEIVRFTLKDQKPVFGFIVTDKPDKNNPPRYRVKVFHGPETGKEKQPNLKQLEPADMATSDPSRTAEIQRQIEEVFPPDVDDDDDDE